MQNKIVASIFLVGFLSFGGSFSFAQSGPLFYRDSLESTQQRMLSNRKVVEEHYQNSFFSNNLVDAQFDKVLAYLSFPTGYIRDGALVSVRIKDAIYYGDDCFPAGSIMAGRGFFHGDTYFVNITSININGIARQVHFQLFDYVDFKQGICIIIPSGRDGIFSSLKLDISISSIIKVGTDIKIDNNKKPILRVKNDEYPCWILADYSDGYPESRNHIFRSLAE